MALNYLRVLIFVSVFQNIQIYCQICVATNMTWREVPETYTYTYLEAYEKSNCLFWCTDTRVATAIGMRTVKKQIPEQNNICCNGYTEEKSLSGNSFYCIPVCSSVPCINGYCKSPEVCTCNPGYSADVLEPNRCNAMCIKGCDHGNCTAPNTCSCNVGYEFVDGTCEPICKEACNNGICISPNVCQCHPGYKKSEFGICEPFCSNYTDTGECIVTVTCEPGWEKDPDTPFETCRPVCNGSCVFGKCLAPEECECLQGYAKSITNICEPYCSSTCVNGICINPELCVCQVGYYKNDSEGTCLPHCDVACGNGVCVAPNVCECVPGYTFVSNLVGDQARNNLCVPICKKCTGWCRATKECTCTSPAEPVFVSSDGNICDCFDNCSITDHKCDTIVCLLFGVTNYLNDTNGAVKDLMLDTTSLEDISATSNIENKKRSRYDLNWLYALGSVFLTATVIIIAVIVKKNRKKIFKNKHPQSIGDDISAVVRYKQSSFT